MKVVFPFLVVISIFVGLFLLGRYATKKHINAITCISRCGDGVCGYNVVCEFPPCGCSENAVVCPRDCH